MKKNEEIVKNYIMTKLIDPEEIAKRLNLKLTSRESLGEPLKASAILPNVEFPGKKWTLISVSFVLDIILEKIITSALGGPAGTIWLVVQMASLFIDIVDPYGYNQALSRSDIDEAVSIFNIEITKILKENIKPKMIEDALKELDNKGIDRQVIIDISDVFTDYWREAPGLIPDKSCYGDLKDFNSLSGPPGGQCNEIYKNSYEQYVVDNGEIYIKKATPENVEEIDRIFSTIYSSIVKNNLKIYRDSVVRINILIITVISTIIFLIFFIKYITKRK